MWMMLYVIVFDVLFVWPILMGVTFLTLNRDKIGIIEYLLFFRGFANQDPRSLVTISF